MKNGSRLILLGEIAEDFYHLLLLDPNKCVCAARGGLGCHVTLAPPNTGRAARLAAAHQRRVTTLISSSFLRWNRGFLLLKTVSGSGEVVNTFVTVIPPPWPGFWRSSWLLCCCWQSCSRWLKLTSDKLSFTSDPFLSSVLPTKRLVTSPQAGLWGQTRYNEALFCLHPSLSLPRPPPPPTQCRWCHHL